MQESHLLVSLTLAWHGLAYVQQALLFPNRPGRSLQPHPYLHTLFLPKPLSLLLLLFLLVLLLRLSFI
jgi:hypothetical protein